MSEVKHCKCSEDQDCIFCKEKENRAELGPKKKKGYRMHYDKFDKEELTDMKNMSKQANEGMTRDDSSTSTLSVTMIGRLKYDANGAATTPKLYPSWLFSINIAALLSFQYLSASERDHSSGDLESSMTRSIVFPIDS